jgi:RNA polymerase sigma factor (sigma-70 family)
MGITAGSVLAPALPLPEEFVDHYARLRRLCRLLLGDAHEAADVVQEVFLRATASVRSGEAPRDWGRWLTRVAVNACHDRRRSGWWLRFRRRTVQVDELGLAVDWPSPETLAMDGETRARIWQAFRTLPPRQQEVFVLRHLEEWSTYEVATALGVSAGSVKRHLFRAIRHLRLALGGTP